MGSFTQFVGAVFIHYMGMLFLALAMMVINLKFRDFFLGYEKEKVNGGDMGEGEFQQIRYNVTMTLLILSVTLAMLSVGAGGDVDQQA